MPRHCRVTAPAETIAYTVQFPPWYLTSALSLSAAIDHGVSSYDVTSVHPSSQNTVVVQPGQHTTRGGIPLPSPPLPFRSPGLQLPRSLSPSVCPTANQRCALVSVILGTVSIARAPTNRRIKSGDILHYHEVCLTSCVIHRVCI